MSTLNLTVFLQAINDAKPSNAPSLQPFRWNRDIIGQTVQNPANLPLTLVPGQSVTLFDHSRALAQDDTTAYTLALKPLSTATYVLSVASGTLPNFRTPRNLAMDATTTATIALNGPISTITFGGTTPTLTSVVPGDIVYFGSNFNASNQGQFTILAVTSSSITINNPDAYIETVALGSGFATQLEIFSAAGVQIGDTLRIANGFSSTTFGEYSVSAVYANSLEFNSTAVLAQQSSILASLVIYSDAKSIIYVESSQNSDISVNGGSVVTIEPFVCGASTKPGMFLLKSTVYSLSISNSSAVNSNITCISAE